jgi:tetratricopeptide (TPR) repeat protein
MFSSCFCSLSTISDDEKQALKYVKCGQIDEAINTYERLTPDSPRILSIIGVLYCDKKGDYDSAIHYFKRALDIQEKVYR